MIIAPGGAGEPQVCSLQEWHAMAREIAQT